MKILAIIPARSGSKGILNKNIRLFAGKPLISYAIAEAKKSKYIDRVLVSTEDEKIASISKKYGAEVPFLRPVSLARDKSSVVDAVVDLLEKLRRLENYFPDYILLLQTTSPLRSVKDIDGAISFFLKRKADSLVSVCRTEALIFSKNKNNLLHLLNPNQAKSMNRQLQTTTYKLDGSMIFLINTKIFLKKKSFLAGKLLGYEIDRWRGVDLDESQDFVVGEIIYKNRKKISKIIKKFK